MTFPYDWKVLEDVNPKQTKQTKRNNFCHPLVCKEKKITQSHLLVSKKCKITLGHPLGIKK